MIDKTAKIYALIDPITKQIRYIGQTRQSLEVRLGQHWRDRHQGKEKNQHKANWINKLYSDYQLKPSILLIEDLGKSDEIDDLLINSRERYWIEYYYNKNCELTNTSGKMYFRITSDVKNTNQKKIYAYNKNYEEFVFKSARDASKFTNISYKRISDICISDRTNLNYCFSFKKLSTEEIQLKFTPKNKRCKIKAINLKTKEELYFNSQTEAAKYLNCNFRNINQVLKNQRRSCKGHFFSYIE